MPPPRRAKIEIREAPKASATSASTTLAVVGGEALDVDQEVEEDRDGEQGEAGDQHAGDRAGAEGDGEAALQAGARRLGGADVGADRDVHADEAGDAREQGAEHEADRLEAAEEEADQDGDDDADDGDRAVLAEQIGLGAFLDGGGDGHHPLVAGGRLRAPGMLVRMP